jgi:glycosyltransferase involved in cell wall biosynthesis
MSPPARVLGFDATPLESALPTGVGQYAARLLSGLADERYGWRPVLLAQHPPSQRMPRLELAPRVIPIPWRYLWIQLALPLALRRLRPDLCHFTNSIAPLSVPCPYVLTIHDASLHICPETHPARRRWITRPFLGLSARRAAAVITVSQSARVDIIRTLGLPERKVHVVYEAAGSEFFPVTDGVKLESVRARYGLDHPFVLYVGAVEPRKNLPRLFEAFRRICREGFGEHLIVAGPLGWKYHGILRGVRRSDPIRFLGFVAQHDLPALYSLARVFVFPSLYEGFGLPILEAMACGVPVVTTQVSSMPEVAGGAAILTNPLDSDSIADGILRILRDSSLHTELRQAGLARARQLSWELAARETARIYDAATQNPKH